MTQPSVKRPARLLFLVLDVALLGLFLAGFLARYVSPERIWWFQLAGIVLPFSALLLPIGAFLAARHRAWRLFGVHVVFLLMAGFRFLSLGGSGAPATPDGDALRLLTYNIGHPEKTDSDTQREHMAVLLDTVQADLIGFQEFVVRYRNRQPRLRNIPQLNALFDSLQYSAFASELNDVSTSFLPVLAYNPRLELVQQERILLHRNGEPEIAVKRVQFVWQNREAVLFNVHLRTFGMTKIWEEEDGSFLNWRLWPQYARQYREAFRMRAWEAREILKLIEKETSPVILSGDFNSTPHNHAYHILTGSLRDAYREAGSGWGATFPAGFPLVRIDHVLVSPEWDIRAADVIKIGPSDHLPTLVQLAWKETAP